MVPKLGPVPTLERKFRERCEIGNKGEYGDGAVQKRVPSGSQRGAA